MSIEIDKIKNDVFKKYSKLPYFAGTGLTEKNGKHVIIVYWEKLDDKIKNKLANKFRKLTIEHLIVGKIKQQ